MRKNISLDEFIKIQHLLAMLRNIGLLGAIDFGIIWEKKPQLIINRNGEFEFENPQELYGAIITFWDAEGKIISKTRFSVGE